MRTPWTARTAAVVVTIAMALGLVVVGGVVGARRPAAVEAAGGTAASAPPDRLAQTVARLQERLRRLPADWVSWANLGLAYLERSRVTSDPTYYPKAEQAVARSLVIRPRGNAVALVALGALANARHDFAPARDHARAAIRLDRFNADAYAVLADAHTQLGDTRAATAAVQHLLDLRPGLPAYTRASYDLEQRGQLARAVALMRRALASAVDGADIAYCQAQLGDLALGAGDLAAAQAHYSAALAADPTSLVAARGRALVMAASGKMDEALDVYGALTRRVPAPAYFVEYAQLLRQAGRDDDAQAQLRLAEAAQELFQVNGGVDGLTGAYLALAQGRIGDGLAQASAEWRRRHHVDVADVLAWALHLSGRDTEALRYARRVAATGARSTTYAYHRGMIEAVLGLRAQARAHLRLALRSPLYAAPARQALSKLESS